MFSNTSIASLRRLAHSRLPCRLGRRAGADPRRRGRAPAPAPAPTPDYTLTANVGLFSQYVFRGIAQTAGQPAVQGGFDCAHSSGFYLGTWASNISWLEDFGLYNRSSLEWDFYGGYKNTFPGSEDWTYDVGLYYYYYPGHARTPASSTPTRSRATAPSRGSG